jgi:hypothetical protein
MAISLALGKKKNIVINSFSWGSERYFHRHLVEMVGDLRNILKVEILDPYILWIYHQKSKAELVNPTICCKIDVWG